VERALSAFATTLFDGDATVESAHDDPRETFAVRVKTDGVVDGAQALARIASVVTES
jgi:hypothetical protein